MKKGIIIGGVAVLIVLLIILSFYSYNKDSYDKSKEISLGFANSLSYLQECKSVEGQDRANLSERLRTCPSLSDQKTFDKLEIIKDLKGVSECESEGNLECNKVVEGCEVLTSFSYEISATSGGHVPYSEGVGIHNCNGNYYLSKSSGPPPEMKIFRIQLDEETINGLKD